MVGTERQMPLRSPTGDRSFMSNRQPLGGRPGPLFRWSPERLHKLHDIGRAFELTEDAALAIDSVPMPGEASNEAPLAGERSSAPESISPDRGENGGVFPTRPD